MRTVMLAGIVILALTCGAQAQSPTPAPSPSQAQVQGPSSPVPPPAVPAPPPGSRFQFDKVNGGFVRFDSQTGKMAYCSPRTVGWNCEAVPQDRSALERQITHLNDEIAVLRKQIEDLREKSAPPPTPPQPVPPPPAAPVPDKNGNVTIALPSHADLQRARAYVQGALQDTWRRLVELIGNFQKNLMRQG